MLVIGIDPGTAITGYGLVREQQNGTLTVVDYGVIQTPADLEMPQRLLQLYRELKQLTLLHRPDSGAVEKLFFQKNVRTAISVGQGRGIAILALAEAGVSIGEYTPLEIKQAIAGYGGADKAQVQYMVKAMLELDEIPHPDDAADALAVAICHIHNARYKMLTGQT
ncbi:MAG TPA: crossover junction endodeoxyribonuclease RuvC [Chloroflexi bacterium]|nr:crossover junction endodeoxyribonuclease RuvC [Chloroflexota bacterium]HBY07885.1 crossover junction endodeoxyribonuclease RuvC [Chloroflexota bacterium]